MGTPSATRHTNEDDKLLTQILDAVATEEQCDILDLPPLFETLSPEMLLRVVDGAGVNEVAFQYLGYTITIHGEDSVQVTLAPE